ncbi:hypothetical protein RRG08_052104 [Elysia crispata]|uniref:Uncharacterized protein n=1 Tax=Elysia crispata TaxID=231223 RepID=A0AAE1A5S3_9GAST|nr:hypothetical protein RRG08_052104 [Elysia crispata]
MVRCGCYKERCERKSLTRRAYSGNFHLPEPAPPSERKSLTQRAYSGTFISPSQLLPVRERVLHRGPTRELSSPRASSLPVRERVLHRGPTRELSSPRASSSQNDETSGPHEVDLVLSPRPTLVILHRPKGPRSHRVTSHGWLCPGCTAARLQEVTRCTSSDVSPAMPQGHGDMLGTPLSLAAPDIPAGCRINRSPRWSRPTEWRALLLSAPPNSLYGENPDGL